MGKLPVKSEMMEDQPVKSKDKVKNARKIMQAITKHAMNPKKKKSKGPKVESVEEERLEKDSKKDSPEEEAAE